LAAVRVALAQLDTTAGDVRGNLERIAAAWSRAKAQGADLVVVPELALLGYPPRDLLLREGVVRAALEATEELARRAAAGPPLVVGALARNPEATGPALVNAAAFLRGGRVEALYAKRLLPTYDVFDERRYFAPGRSPVVVPLGGRRVGLLVCEDLWSADRPHGRRLYDADPPGDARRAGADLLVAISASPYHGGKDAQRRALFAGEARRTGLPLVSVQLVGGNDDVLFDGRSRVLDAQGREVARLAAFEEELRVLDLDAVLTGPTLAAEDLAPAEELRRALVMGLRGYAQKTGFRRALVGLSGGVDSAVTACLAADALGPEHVLGVSLPSRYTAAMSRDDARDLTQRLGIGWLEIPIEVPFGAMLSVLNPAFEGKAPDVTEENLQARIRGAILMALSNKHGHLLLATGNKSEVSVGYCTLYGDTNGGLAVISDVWKTAVYDVARLYEAEGRLPPRSITRPPSAELRPDQRDTDSLPPYDVLDPILRLRIEEGLSLDEIVARGTDRATATRVLRLVERSEYKRRQLAPGLKVTPVAFGSGWRMPIARPTDLSSEA
jgi:NAD+ synthase/NAD+ synthase (glutamine-hydrolysing)